MGHPDFGKAVLCQCRQHEVNAGIRNRLFAMSNLDELQHLTFETFEPRGRIGINPMQAGSLENAFNSARMFAQSLEGWILYQGRYGCGKTHLAAAIANFVVDLGVETLFITVPDMLDSLRYAYNDADFGFEERFERIKNIRLLVLDDFGTQNATSWAQEKLFQILNFRYINKLPTVITTNLALEEIEGRIRSRLQDPMLVHHIKVTAPDFRRPMDDTGHHELSSLEHLSSRKFGNFDMRKREQIDDMDKKSLEKAFRAAQAFAEAPKGWLVFMGTYGCGKTHLAAAIANYRAAAGHPPLFVMVPDLLDHLRATFAPDSGVRYDRRFDEIRATPLLILDDLGTQAMSPWVKEKLYQLFNHRYNAELPTVITTSDELDKLDPRLRTRITDTRVCTIHFITAPSYSALDTGRKRRHR